MSLRNLNIAPRAFLGFAFIALLVIVLGVFAVNRMSIIRQASIDMDVTQLGANTSGIPVYWDKTALAADGVVTISRIKPHTDFQGTYESGIVKMLVIGLGKQAGALVHHAYGVRGLRDFIPQSVKVILDKTKFLAGLAIVENADDEPGCIELIDRDDLLVKEPGLLSLARAWMAPAVEAGRAVDYRGRRAMNMSNFPPLRRLDR